MIIIQSPGVSDCPYLMFTDMNCDTFLNRFFKLLQNHKTTQILIGNNGSCSTSWIRVSGSGTNSKYYVFKVFKEGNTSWPLPVNIHCKNILLESDHPHVSVSRSNKVKKVSGSLSSNLCSWKFLEWVIQKDFNSHLPVSDQSQLLPLHLSFSQLCLLS